jgi:hypothetical protein
MWLWPSLIQKELDKFCAAANNRRVRKQNDKVLPSGVSPNVAFLFPEKFGGRDCLQHVDMDLVDKILDDMREEKEASSDWGVPMDFAVKAQAAYEQLKSPEVTMDTVWVIFAAILPYCQST